MAEPCDICDGRRIIRLPIRFRPSLRPSAADFKLDATAPSYREFPCPNCAPKADDNRVLTMEASIDVQVEYLKEPGYVAAAHHQAARMLADEMLEQGYIAVRKDADDSGDDPFFPRKRIYATVGVVTPKVVRDLKLRIAEHQDRVARDVIVEATRKIDVWGSSFGATGIAKHDARRFLMEALDEVIVERRKAALA